MDWNRLDTRLWPRVLLVQDFNSMDPSNKSIHRQRFVFAKSLTGCGVAHATVGEVQPAALSLPEPADPNIPLAVGSNEQSS